MVDIRPFSAPAASDLRLALYEPDIPQNAGTLMRLCACLGLPLDLIEPAGFDASDRNLRRAGLDYLHALRLERHLSFRHFEQWRRAHGHRLVLATTRADVAHHHFRFSPGDILLLGRESAGVPDHVHEAADARLAIPLRPGLRSLNVAVAGGILVAEAMRQLDLFPPMATTGGLDVPSP
ncbi:MAG: tRNA (cytidine(34)-2'-O)-methyltransferase [Rhabdaerophilum sp.]